MKKKEIEDFIELINTSNAASSIGTLQYIDELSKFNVVNNICLNIDENKLLEKFDELYSDTYKGNYMKSSSIVKNTQPFDYTQASEAPANEDEDELDEYDDVNTDDT